MGIGFPNDFTMKHVLLLITTTIAMAFLAITSASAQQNRTLKSEMEVIHESLGVNFIYESSLEINMPYSGKPMRELLEGRRADAKTSVMPDIDHASLELCLQTLFDGTGIGYEIMKKYIVLTKSDGRRKPKDYTIFIEEQHDTLDEALLTAYIDRRHQATQTGLSSIDGSRFTNGYAVLGSADFVKEIQFQTGVAGGTELLSGMYVHGGDGTDNLFLVDGVPLYQVSHLAGLISSFNTEVVDNMDFYKSGFPSRFGGKLSSVVDITTRSGDLNHYHGSFNIGLLNGGLQFEGPIVPGKTSFNVAVRRSWFDFVTIPYNMLVNLKKPYGDSGMVNYAMTDFNASVTHLFDKDSKLSLNVYGGADNLIYEWTDQMVKYWEGVRYTGKSGYGLDIRWSNLLTSLNWEKKFSDDLHINTILYYVRSNSGVGITLDSWKMDEQSPTVTSEQRVDRNFSKMHDVGAKAEVDWIPSEYHHISSGASYVRHLFRPVREFTRNREVGGKATYSENDSYSVRYDASEFSAYASDEMAPCSWFKLNLGLRYTFFNQGESMYHSLEPRAAIRFQLGKVTALKMSYTEMSQSVHLLRANYLDIPMSMWMPSTSRISPMRSRQVAAGVYTDLEHGISLKVEGYWKSMENLYEYAGIDGLYPDISVWEGQLMQGEGRSYGLETEARWQTTRMEIAAYYTLSWTERFFRNIWHSWYPARNDNRHKFTLTATRKFSDRFDMYIGWHYHSGDRITVPDQIMGTDTYHTSPYNHKMSDYHRLDLGFNFHRTTKRGNEGIWNITLYNAYCRMNPMYAELEYYMPSYDRPENKTRFVEIAAIPIIPSFNYTLRF